MKTLDEVIKATHHCGLISGFDGSYEYNGGCPYEDCSVCENKRALGKDIIKYLEAYKDDKDDLTALRAFWKEQQANPPLTWDELKEMVGKPVWMEAGNGSRWIVIESIRERVFTDGEYLKATNSGEFYDKDFGELWQAYRKERK